jgi:hypothetical protein
MLLARRRRRSPRPCLQIVHFIAHWGAQRSCRAAAATGTSTASGSTTNLLSHAQHRPACSKEDQAPAVAFMCRLLRRGGCAGGAAKAGAASSDPAHACSAGTLGASKHGDQAAAAEAGSARSSCDDDGCSVTTQDPGLSAPVEGLTEPCDAVTSAVMAASCPDTVASPACSSPAYQVGVSVSWSVTT